ncbi:MAG: class I SAM-dependent methyltransferase [Desulfobacteraceae bacterium]|nr:class I SAM-dependent methyltransferase [Desulfobacteraceae bacterium]
MAMESKEIKEIYAGKVAEKFDLLMPLSFTRFKKLAFEDSSLKNGDRVLVFCCGTGLDFPHILKKVGPDGKIVGVDFSSEMLNQAKAKGKAKREKWRNIELIEADITKFQGELDQIFDVGVCTLGMSIIPEYISAYQNLLSYVKKQGDIIISDMQLAPGWLACLNPFTLFLAKKYGGTYEGHKNSMELYSLMQKGLTDVRKKEFFFKSYFYCTGKIR